MSEWDPITESFDVERTDPDSQEPDEPQPYLCIGGLIRYGSIWISDDDGEVAEPW